MKKTHLATSGPEGGTACKAGDTWQPPEKVVGPFAGEATFDAGNLYFTHHFWDDGSNNRTNPTRP